MRFSLGIKIGLTLLGVSWLVISQDWSAVFTRFQSVNGWALSLAMILSLFMIPLHAARWHTMMTVHTREISFTQILRYTFIGFFSNLFLPSSMGGDAVKSIALGRVTNSMASSVATTLLARLFGLIVLYLLFWFFLYFNQRFVNELSREIPVMLSLGGVGSVIVILTILRPRIALFPKNSTLARKAKSLGDAWYRLIRAKALLVQTMVWTVAIQLANLSFSFLAFRSFSPDISIGGLLVATPLMTIIAMVPITIFNIGVRESLAIYFLGRLAGLDASACIAGSSVGYLAAIIQALPGAWIMLKPKD